jgi:hypothetical protein
MLFAAYCWQSGYSLFKIKLNIVYSEEYPIQDGDEWFEKVFLKSDQVGLF